MALSMERVLLSIVFAVLPSGDFLYFGRLLITSIARFLADD